ncbi:MAG: S8 family serine peptidase, partial [Paraclostridium sp.]
MNKSYIIVYNGDYNSLEEELKINKISNYIILNDKIAVIYVDQKFNESKLNKIKNIGWWERSSPMSSMINITDRIESGENVSRASGIDFIEGNPYINQSGKGVMIAIIDSGVNYLHPDFINSSRESNIISIWDQESNKGNPPTGYLFGSEFNKEQINNAILMNDNSLSEDRLGTGTIAAGICCGKGNINSDYRGVATNSELIVVKLREYSDRYEYGKINYQTSDFLAAIKYVEDVASKENKDLIINITVGKSSGPGMEESILESFDFFNKSGVVVVSGAGDEGNTDIHYRGSFKDDKEYQDILIQVGNQINLEIFLYLGGPDKIGAQLISPSGEISYSVQYSAEDYLYKGKYNVENTKYEI